MKLKRLFSGLLVSLIAIVSVLLCVKVSNAAETSIVKADFYNEEKLSTTSGPDAKETYLKSKFTSDFSFSVSGNVRYDMKGGLCFGSSKSSSFGSIKITSPKAFNKVVIYGAAYSSSENKLVVDNQSATSGTIPDPETKLSDITTPLVWEFATSKTSITVGTSSKRSVVYTIELLMSESTPTYSVSFDAGNATFAPGKGETITTAVVTLPTIGDLVYGCKEIMPLSGWSDGTTTHKPGATVPVSNTTHYTAVYEEDNSKVLSVKEAIALYDFLGKKTTKEFKVTGIISAFDKDYPNNITIVDETDNTKELKLTDPAIRVSDTKVVVGDKIIGNGYITKHNSTYQLDYDCTYENVSTKEDMFQRVETMSSLSFDWATTDGETYKVSNVSLRFGNLFRAVAFDSNAQYGVFVIKSSVLGTSTVEQYLSGKTLEEITADTEIINVEATPVKVNAQGVADEKGKYYQFAVVLSDMDEYLTTSITAVMYVVIDGQIYYSVEKTASVKSTADAYINDKALIGTLDEDVQNALSTLAKAE